MNTYWVASRIGAQAFAKSWLACKRILCTKLLCSLGNLTGISVENLKFPEKVGKSTKFRSTWDFKIYWNKMTARKTVDFDRYTSFQLKCLSIYPSCKFCVLVYCLLVLLFYMPFTALYLSLCECECAYLSVWVCICGPNP